jgi:hypothetical protein
MPFYNLIKTETFRSKFRKLEVFSTIIIIYAIIMVLLNISISGIILSLGLSAMALVCFFSGFKVLESGDKLIALVIFKIHGWGLAIAYMAILLEWLHLVNFGIWLLIPLAIIIISLIMGLILRNDENSHFIDKAYFMRLINAITLLSFLFFRFYH